MRPTREHPWRKAALIHDSFWLIPLSQKDRLCYFYLSSFCSNKPWAISLTVMAGALAMDVKRVQASVRTLIDRKMVNRTERKGMAALYWVTDMTLPTWGQTPRGVGANAPDHLGANAPGTWVQTHPLTTNLKESAMASTVEQALLSMFQKHFRKWRFNRKPIGRKFLFTRPMVSKAIECMRFLNQTMHTTEAFDSFLEGCGEYLSLPRDVLSDGSRDQRALSPVQWLNQWPEQVRLAGIYQDEKAEKVTRISSATPAS